MIPYGRQSITDEDIAAIVDVLKSDFLTQGPAIPAFEKAVAARVEAKYSTAVNSATSALHLALSALDVGQGDMVWTSPNTFVASANCAIYCGANVDFVDIDSETFNMSPIALEKKLEAAAASNSLPKVIIPVHMCGQSPDMKEINTLAQRYDIKIVEDASHAIGAEFNNQPVGSCQFSDITVFSFHPVKIITTGEGGLATTNDPNLAQKMQRRRSHGITRDPALMENESHGPWYYEQIELGWNYRMTDIQAALGLSQLSRLDEFLYKRREIFSRYDAALSHLPLKRPKQNSQSAWHLYVIQLDNNIRHERRRVFEYLRDKGIGVQTHYIPVHLQPFYQKMGFSYGHCPIAENVYQRSISLPMHPYLPQADQDYVIQTLTSALHD